MSEGFPLPIRAVGVGRGDEGPSAVVVEVRKNFARCKSGLNGLCALFGSVIEVGIGSTSALAGEEGLQVSMRRI